MNKRIKKKLFRSHKGVITPSGEAFARKTCRMREVVKQSKRRVNSTHFLRSMYDKKLGVIKNET